MNRPTSAALIPAAGLGTRLGMGPKALLRINQRPLLDILLPTVTLAVDEVIIAAPETHFEEISAIAAGRARVITGGADRQESIDRLIAATEAELLIVHDAARPFATQQMFLDVVAAAAVHGAAVTCIEPGVPVGTCRDQQVVDCVSSADVRVFQAPQGFSRSVLKRAQQQRGDRWFQSTAQMVLASGQTLVTVPGAAENIKITTPFDWDIATKVIAPYLDL